MLKQEMVIFCPKCLTENKSTARRCVGVNESSGKKVRCDFWWSNKMLTMPFANKNKG